MSDILRTYSELIKLPTFKERYEYCRCTEKIGDDTFGGARYLNQILYSSQRWKEFRRKVIVRDFGCDLAVKDHPLSDGDIFLIHHLNPLTILQLKNMEPCIFDMENVILCSHTTHNALHYGDISLLVTDPIVRTPNDTCPWRN